MPSKLQNLWESVSKNQNDIENIKFKYIKTETYTFNKKSQVLKILERYPMNADNKSFSTAIQISVPFVNLPNWALSGIHAVPIFYSEEEIIDPIVYGSIECIGNICNLTIESGTNWFFYNVTEKWKFVDNGEGKDGYYVYLADIFAFFQPVNEDGSIQTDVYFPLYLDFDIVIDNNREYQIQQGYKS